MPDSFQSISLVKARKPHKCESCRRQIQPGERYAAIAGRFDGDFYAAKLCQGCESLWELVWQFDREHNDWLSIDGLEFNQIMETAEEFELICMVPLTAPQPHQPPPQ
ncbi:hypothetical protein [Pseudomonas sp. NPDC088444]|uniref:hypothetical protein n=1 Tax=Pseudomonas sp. NPDC088444 TaxID=3364456 RepID=UPI00384DCE18